MKRLLLAIVLLSVGATVCCALHNSTIRLRQQAADTRNSLLTQTQLLADAKIQLTRFEERVRDLKQNLRTQEQLVGSQADPLLFLPGSAHLSATQRERLLAELGFNWKSTGDYLIVSKDTLSSISLDGMHQMRLNPTAADVLALTSDERASIDALTQSLNESYRNWAATHAQRNEPTGKIAAQYTLPADADFSQSLHHQFTSGIQSALGDERGNLFLQYSSSWMTDLGMDGNQSTTMTVTRYANDDTRLNFSLKSSNGNNMSSDVSPYQSFPQAFLPLFPNGWTDLAAREGFALPKSFQK